MEYSNFKNCLVMIYIYNHFGNSYMFYFSQKQRRKIDCPQEDCEAKVVNLAQHLRDKHHWSVGGAASAISVYGL